MANGPFEGNNHLEESSLKYLKAKEPTGLPVPGRTHFVDEPDPTRDMSDELPGQGSDPRHTTTN